MKKKVLVVDDEASVRNVLRRILEKAGNEVIEAEDAAVIADQIKLERPAVILLDIHMPRLDGLSVIEDIRRQSPKTAVVMISGDPGMIDRALERGASLFLTKPLDYKHVESVVAAF